jgi:hypothetical protein
MMTRPSRRWWRQWIAGTDLVIHPNDRVRLVSLQRALPEGLSEWPDLHLEYFAAAEHSEPDEGELNVPGRLIREQALVEFARRMT